jgi:hypothetical protein
MVQIQLQMLPALYGKPFYSLSLHKNSFIHSSMALQPFAGPWPLLQFRNLFYADGRSPWTSVQPRTTQTNNKPTYTHPCLSVGFEPTIPALERAKTVRALDCAAAVIGSQECILRFILNGSPCTVANIIPLSVQKGSRCVRSRPEALLTGLGRHVVTSCLPWTRKQPGGRERTRTECPNRYLATLHLNSLQNGFARCICTLKG